MLCALCPQGVLLSIRSQSTRAHMFHLDTGQGPNMLCALRSLLRARASKSALVPVPGPGCSHSRPSCPGSISVGAGLAAGSLERDPELVPGASPAAQLPPRGGAAVLGSAAAVEAGCGTDAAAAASVLLSLQTVPELPAGLEPAPELQHTPTAPVPIPSGIPRSLSIAGNLASLAI